MRACVALGLAGLLATTGCSGGRSASQQAGATEQASATRSTIRVAVVDDIDVDPAKLDPTSEIDVLAADLLFDGLTRHSPLTGTLEPALAEKWSSPDGIHWTFDLDPKRTFSDGSPVTAADVVASLTRDVSMHAESLGASRLSVIAGAAEMVAGTATSISGLAAPDRHTVTVQAAEKNYELPLILANPTYGVVKEGQDLSRGLSTGLISSGPFVVHDVAASKSDLVSAKGWNTATGQITFTHFDSIPKARAALAKGAVEVAPLGVEAAPEGSVRAQVSGATMVVAVGSDHGFWADVHHRRVLMDGLDRVAVAKAATGDAGTAVDGIAPGGVLSTAVCSSGCQATPEAMAALGGLVPSAGPVHVDALAGGEAEKAAVSIVSELKARGFSAEARASTASAIGSVVAAGGVELLVFGAVGLSMSPDSYLAEALRTGGKENLSGLQSSELDSALTAARGTADDSDRAAAYAKVQRIALESAALIPIARLGRWYGYSDKLKSASPLAGLLFDGTEVSVG